MKLSLSTYRDKVMGCWQGKNIGGTLGGPFEGRRQINDKVEFYVQDLSKGPPMNDDLDLQLVWLAAVEKYGRQVDLHFTVNADEATSSRVEILFDVAMPGRPSQGAVRAVLFRK